MHLAETLIERMAGPSRLRVGRSANVLGTVVYWVVLLFFVTAATQVLGLQTFTDWLARLLDYLPTLAAGVLIIVAGYVLASFVADLVLATATRLQPAQRTALARLAQGATLVAAILVGADQIGIRVTWIAILAAVVIALGMDRELIRWSTWRHRSGLRETREASCVSALSAACRPAASVAPAPRPSGARVFPDVPARVSHRGHRRRAGSARCRPRRPTL
jgi:hypothetical protein